MMMFYSDRDLRFLEQRRQQREYEAAADEDRRRQRVAILSKKPIPVKQPDA